MVVGHFAFENRSNLVMNGICNAIYSFHMPLFIFISGYFSKSIKFQRTSDISSLLVPYLIFEFIHYIFTKSTGLGKGHLQFTYPTYQNWYLLSLFTWRLIIPYFKDFNKPFALFLVVTCSILSGFVQDFNEFLGLYRSIFLLPFFIIGYYFNDLKGVLLKLKSYRWLFAIVFSLLFGLIVWSSATNELIGLKLSYAFIPNFGYGEEIDNLFLRSFSLIFSCIMGFLFLFFIPNKRTFYTKMGANTMTVYLIHIFFIWIFMYVFGNGNTLWSLVLGILFSISLAMVLSSSLTEKIFRPITSPIEFLKKINTKK